MDTRATKVAFVAGNLTAFTLFLLMGLFAGYRIGFTNLEAKL